MNLYSSIFTRKSTRNFELSPLSVETIKQIEDFIANVKPLLPESKITYTLASASEVKGLGVPKAPHYILISGDEQPLRNVCAGFLFQHVELYLYSIGLAARWIAGLTGKKNDPNHIIGIAFGVPVDPTPRTLTEFKRKPIAEISEGQDTRIEAARLAPSGVNAQPWYFIAEKGKIYVYYRRKLSGLSGLVYHFTDLDAGIALCHLAVASEQEGIQFSFNITSENAPEAPDGFEYIGTVE